MKAATKRAAAAIILAARCGEHPALRPVLTHRYSTKD